MSVFDLGNIDLKEIVSDLLSRSKVPDSNVRAGKNLIDPFAAALEVILNNHKTQEDWQRSENLRTNQKNLMNQLGDTQQKMIGTLDGWASYPSGSGMPDIVGVRGSQKVIAEVKNKHNTMNFSSSKETYDELVRFLEMPQYKGFAGLVVTLIAPTSQEKIKHFAPGDRSKRDDVLIVSGRTFYAIATDPLTRQPTLKLGTSSDLKKWESWTAIDSMIEMFWKELEKQSGTIIPTWVKNLVSQAYG